MQPCNVCFWTLWSTGVDVFGGYRLFLSMLSLKGKLQQVEITVEGRLFKLGDEVYFLDKVNSEADSQSFVHLVTHNESSYIQHERRNI